MLTLDLEERALILSGSNVNFRPGGEGTNSEW